MRPVDLDAWMLARLERHHLAGPFTRDGSLRLDAALLRLEAAREEALRRSIRNLLAECEGLAS